MSRSLPPEGPESTHVTRDGAPKVAFDSRESALDAARDQFIRGKRELHPYVCWQKPKHWHLGGGFPDLVPS